MTRRFKAASTSGAMGPPTEVSRGPEPGSLREWPLVRVGVTSRLTEVECLRTLDHLRLDSVIDERRLARLRASVYQVLSSSEVIEMSRTALGAQANGLPTLGVRP